MGGNGGPAFPCPTGTDGGSLFDGMSLRDYFAATVLTGFLSVKGNAVSNFEMASARAYRIADAMLAEREK